MARIEILRTRPSYVARGLSIFFDTQENRI